MKESVIADVKILPCATESASLSRYVAACDNILKQAGDISYQVTPMATIIQGPLERVLELIQEMHEVPFTMGIKRVVTSVSIDDRRDKHISMESKVQAVNMKL